MLVILRISFYTAHMEQYIWQNEHWPQFAWNEQTLLEPLLEVHTNEGVLRGQMQAVGFQVQSEETLQRFVQEIKKSFEIEGENISDYALRSSVARQLKLENLVLASDGQLDSPRAKVDAIVEVITDAVHNCNEPLTLERLCVWHEKLFRPNDSGRGCNGLYTILSGKLRTDEDGPMRVISGMGKNEIVHFQAPPAEQLPAQMRTFLDWFNAPATSGNVIKSAIAHLYFVTLHPFEDGNGRLARAVADMALCRDGSSATLSRVGHLFSMSAQLCKERKAYYAQLEMAQKQKDMDITAWLLWYIGCMNRAIITVLDTLQESQKKKRFWEKTDGLAINERQKKILALLLDGFEGNLTSSKYAKICHCSQDTAGRDIEKLIVAGLMQQTNAGGRSTAYEIRNP